MKVFVDTAAWIALANVDDELHSRADQTAPKYQGLLDYIQANPGTQ